MRTVDADKLRVKAIKECPGCHLNGSRYCKTTCSVNEVVKIIDSAPTLETFTRKELEWWQSLDTSEEQYGKAVHEFKQNWLERSGRACYPVHMTTPGLFPQHSSAYFDPTRRLLFTGYMTEELAKNLGIKWWRE